MLLVAQRNASDDSPDVDDLYQVGTVSNILQLLKLPDGTIKVLVEGEFRAAIEAMNDEGDYTVAHVAAELKATNCLDEEEDECVRLQRWSCLKNTSVLSKKVPPRCCVAVRY